MDGPYRNEIEKLEALYADNPEGRVFTHLAEAYRKAGELERAHEIIEGGLQRHAEYSSAHVVLGRVRLDLGDREGATHAFERVIELDPHNLVALRALGELTRHAGRHEKALRYYRDLLVLDPSDQEAADYVSARRFEPPEAGPPAPRPRGGASGTREWWSPVEPEPVEEAGVPGVGEVDASVGPPEGEVTEGVGSRAAGGSEVAPDADAVDETDPWDRVLATTEGEPPRQQAREPRAGEPMATGSVPEESPPSEAAAQPAVEETASEAVPEPFLEESPSAASAEEAATEPPESPSAGEEALSAVSDSDAGEDSEEVRSSPDTGASVDLDENLDWLWSAEVVTYESLEAEHEVTASPGSGASTEEHDEGPARELFTETMAELYIQQGFHDRAVEVYRELIRQRPDEERLRARLREAEARAEDAAAEAGAVMDEPESPIPSWMRGEGPRRTPPVPDEARVEEVESAWTGGSGAMDEEASLYTWEGEGQAEESSAGGRTIGEYFGSLLGWGGGASPPLEARTEAPSPPLEPRAGPPWAPVESGSSGERGAETGMEPSGDEDEDIEMFRAWLQSLKY